MSGFAALTGFEGDSDDVLAAQKRREAKQKAAAAAEAAATRARFDELKASAGATNWADSDEDDDAFFGNPPGLGAPPGLQVRSTRRVGVE
jgi:membrane protein involved in colicin uptake